MTWCYPSSRCASRSGRVTSTRMEVPVPAWTEPDCAALAGGNLLRALRAAEAFSRG